MRQVKRGRVIHGAESAGIVELQQARHDERLTRLGQLGPNAIKVGYWVPITHLGLLSLDWAVMMSLRDEGVTSRVRAGCRLYAGTLSILLHRRETGTAQARVDHGRPPRPMRRRAGGTVNP